MAEDENLPSWKKRDRKASSKMAQLIEEKSFRKSRGESVNEDSPQKTPRKVGTTPVRSKTPARPRTSVAPKKTPVRSRTAVVPKEETPEAISIPMEVLEDGKRGTKGFKRRGRPTEKDKMERELYLKAVENGLITPKIEEPPPKKRRISPVISVKKQVPSPPEAMVEVEAVIPSVKVRRSQGVYSNVAPVSAEVPTPTVDNPKIIHSVPQLNIIPRKSFSSNIFSSKPKPAAVTIRFLKPKVQTLAFCPKPRPYDADRTSALKAALGITRPSSSSSASSSDGSKENVKVVPLQVQTDTSFVESSPKASPSIIALPNRKLL